MNTVLLRCDIKFKLWEEKNLQTIDLVTPLLRWFRARKKSSSKESHVAERENNSLQGDYDDLLSKSR